jgi:uncharacterized protein (TIGR02266 family)
MPGRSARRSTRCDFQVPIQIDGPSGPTVALTENIGAGGLFVATSKPARVGDRISLIFRLPNGNTPVFVDGEVRWVRTRPLLDARHGVRGMGIRFMHLSLSVSATIQEFLRRSNSEGSDP